MSENPSEPGRPLRAAVVGATGAVGEVLLRVLEERKLPLASLLPLASSRSAGQRVRFGGELLTVEEATPEAFAGCDVAFFAATGSLSMSLAPEAVERGAVVIDKSATWRMDPRVPLVVPEVNAAALDGHRGIVASPNCTTTGVVMALEPLRREAGLEQVVVTTLQAVSGAGLPGLEELAAQERAQVGGGEAKRPDVGDGEAKRPDVGDGEAGGREAGRPAVFGAPIFRNVVPHCDDFDGEGYTAEETKLQQETRKILASAPGGGDAEARLPVAVQCVRVPVPVGHSASIWVRCARPFGEAGARKALAAFPGVELCHAEERGRYPTARECAGRDEIFVGRVRADRGSDALWLWQVGDNLRKGAATNAVQIAEALRERGLL